MWSNCPVHAIPQDHPDQTNTEQCISCMRCIVVCPKHARGLNPIVKAATANKLKKSLFSAKRKPLDFITSYSMLAVLFTL